MISVFSSRQDPSRGGGKFFVDGSFTIFKKEIAYVQEGLLSDVPPQNTEWHSMRFACHRHASSLLRFQVPNMFMYQYVRTLKTGFKVFRCLRTSSPLEGYHLHFRQAQHPGAKCAGPRLEMPRSNLFDFAWSDRDLNL